MPGFIFYSGPSLIDGKPVIGVCITASSNRKTGASVAQTYIMPDGISPLDASKTGADVSVCGSCKHRGKPTDDPMKKQAAERSCYVLLGQGPTIVYKELQRGIYPTGDASMIRKQLAGKVLRMGSWGDPAAIPLDAWELLLQAATGGHTGYTHNAQHQPSITRYCMVSADDATAALQAHASGKRTFRVIPIADAGKPLLKHEIECPSYRGVTCSECRLCVGTLKGNHGKSIAIVAHGSGAKYA